MSDRFDDLGMEKQQVSKQRWKDTLPDVEAQPNLAWAARLLADALAPAHVLRTYTDSDGLYTAHAAAHIRAYRKSLGVKSKRCDSLNEGMTPDELLWSAMSHLCYAGLFHDDDEPKYTAYHLRAAEADLRELWKRGQA